MDLGISGNGAVVTGGASGIGHAAARGLAREGVRVALWDLADSVTEVARQIAAEHGVEAIGVQADVTDAASVATALQATRATLGAIDHLVHSAAIGSGKFGFPFTNLIPEDWIRTLNVNILGMVQVAHAVAPTMLERGQGTMVFVASVAGQIGSQTDPPYSASKAANINFAQCMAKDLAPRGIRVNTVCPGMVQTALNRAVWQAWHDHQPPEKRRDYEDWAGEKIRNLIPMGSWQTAENIADMIVFLSSRRSCQVTGQTINVDGGFVMHW
ncbi:MAG: SDR family oxidoreductase [Planctomycetes bacterium]|nr:SDR family oxidoreductase [Planctomycetota bacterium]